MLKLGMSPPTERRWTELWTTNPAFRPDRPVGWAIDGGDGLAGFIGNLPRQMWDGRREIIALVPTTWIVDPAARTYSLPLLFKWLKQPGADLLLNSSASIEAAALFDRLQIERVPCPSLGSRSIWITSYSAVLAGLAKSRWSGGGFLGAFGRPLDVVARIASPRRGSRALEWASEFGVEFDAFWATFSARMILQSVRDAANLKWSYGHAVSSGKAWLVVDRDPRGLRGYAVLERNDIQSLGLARVKLVDVASLDGDPVPFLSAAMARCRSEGVHVIETTGFDDHVHARLARTRPIRVAMDRWPAFWRTADAALADQLRSASGWSFGLYDGDSSVW